MIPAILPPCCASCRSWRVTFYNVDLGICGLTAWDAQGGHAHASSSAKVQVDGPIRGDAVLETTADFHCVQWARR